MTAPLGHDPLVFIISGPSGSGKSTLVKKLLELPGMLWSISCTTRPPRPGEKDGEWYNFVTEEEFDRMVEGDEFLEHACVFGKHRYGTPRRWVDQARERGLDLVLEIDVQGAAQLREKLPAAIEVFILPPSRQALEQRIRARGQDSQEEIERRLERATQELELYSKYDYVVVNDELECAGRQLQAIAVAARCRRAANERRVQKILDSFGG
jgi:guanylate kinase